MFYIFLYDKEIKSTITPLKKQYYDLIRCQIYVFNFALDWHSILPLLCVFTSQNMDFWVTYCGYIKLSQSVAGLNAPE